jgi:hypothetical protein
VSQRPLQSRLPRWLGAAIRGELVGAASVREANAALTEPFAGILVRSRRGHSPRLGFVLAERPPGAPLVSSRLWADQPEWAESPRPQG